jgi:FMN reductase
MTFADGTPLDKLSIDVQRAAAAVASADGVVLASPVYRGTLTGALKNFLDLLPFEALYQKPVGIVAMGATAHHFLGTASHLRDICAWFGALVTPTDVYLTSAQFVEGEAEGSAKADLDALLLAVAAFAERMKKEPMGPVPLAGRAR